MNPPENGAIVRFYRIGHGDCFLIAFGQPDKERPFFVMIDCGRKHGSNAMLSEATDPKKIAGHIMTTTGGFVDVAILTHEHDDHLNGIDEDNFVGLRIGELWLAWTESESDEVAALLRHKKKQDLATLKSAATRLGLNAASEADKKANRIIADLFEMEAGMPVADYASDGNPGADGKPAKEGSNKKALRIFRKAAASVRYLYPHQKPLQLGKSKNQKAFVLGPPRDAKKLRDEDPDAAHAFPDGKEPSYALGFAAAIEEIGDDHESGRGHPFAKEFSVPLEEALKDTFYNGHYKHRYGPAERTNADPHLQWRRIDNDWLDSAGQLALQMNTGTNNTSVVIAFELTPGGKVLLFAADAQAGNWLSWNDAKFPSGGKNDAPIWPKELLKRTVLYKVGHHGSHNATLKGKPDDAWPNLSWLAQGEYANEFTGMITAVRKWAIEIQGWDHPLAAIREALLQKASYRVFQTDTPPSEHLMAMKEEPETAENASRIIESQAWKQFDSRMTEQSLYFDLKIFPDAQP